MPAKKLAIHDDRAVTLADLSVERFGFVVVDYVSEKPPEVGHCTYVIWQIFAMPRAFRVERKATTEERKAQLDLAKEVFNARPQPAEGGTPWVLVAVH